MIIRITLFIFLFGINNSFAQQTDSLKQIPPEVKKHAYVKGAILPAALVGLGIYTVRDNGFYSSYDASKDARREFPNFSTKADDFVFFIPALGLYAFDLFSSQNRHHIGRQTGLLLSSGALMGALVYPLKAVTNVTRPNGENNRAFPSGHTSSAFVIATVIDKEFRAKSPWISAGAYAIASSTGVMRVLNNEHWMSDVLAGAGIGLISVHTVYYIHEHYLKNKRIAVVPTTLFGGQGLTLMATF
ncbi:phosphatase PAP2 family protein [Adhaeribacter aquaticus]|uniref:phosphatase PAP2 family protein n=1 Tax=Adhaeribacter aquaticus TaxID=299567 RepID=UPI0004090733|nr:phosphatase PAP2 family protein [Adhaeribacter aquaticus]